MLILSRKARRDVDCRGVGESIGWGEAVLSRDSGDRSGSLESADVWVILGVVRA